MYNISKSVFVLTSDKWAQTLTHNCTLIFCCFVSKPDYTGPLYQRLYNVDIFFRIHSENLKGQKQEIVNVTQRSSGIEEYANQFWGKTLCRWYENEVTSEIEN